MELEFRGQRTGRISFDATASDMKTRLEALETVSEVVVTRRVNGRGYDWMVTFVGELGELPTMQVSTAGLTGPEADAEVAVVQSGVLPRGYGTVSVQADSVSARLT